MNQQLSNLYNASSHLTNKEFLTKYCYFDNTTIGESLRNYTMWLLDNCTDTDLLAIVRQLFEIYIMPFYLDKNNRTYFNKLRSYFMKFVLILLINDKNDIVSVEDFYRLYPKMSIDSGINNEPDWFDTAQELMVQTKEIFYDISNNT